MGPAHDLQTDKFSAGASLARGYLPASWGVPAVSFPESLNAEEFWRSQSPKWPCQLWEVCLNRAGSGPVCRHGAFWAAIRLDTSLLRRSGAAWTRKHESTVASLRLSDYAFREKPLGLCVGCFWVVHEEATRMFMLGSDVLNIHQISKRQSQGAIYSVHIMLALAQNRWKSVVALCNPHHRKRHSLPPTAAQRATSLIKHYIPEGLLEEEN